MTRTQDSSTKANATPEIRVTPQVAALVGMTPLGIAPTGTTVDMIGASFWKPVPKATPAAAAPVIPSKTTSRVEFKGMPFEVTVDARRVREYRDLNKRTRIYVGANRQLDPESLYGIKSPSRAENDPSLTNKIWKAYNAMEIACMEACLTLAIEVKPEVMAALGVKSTDDAKWSRKAGCRCGCSPGFTVSTNNYGNEAWVEVKAVRALAIIPATK